SKESEAPAGAQTGNAHYRARSLSVSRALWRPPIIPRFLRQRTHKPQLNRDVFLVHRLDREAAGLMLIAHTGKAAAALSALFADHTAGAQVIDKRYQVEVRGELPLEGHIQKKLDSKPASTHFRRLAFDAERNVSLAEVLIDTGRKHQIRRHLAGIGCPVLGDPQYGEGNSDVRGLQLFAVQLKFYCPLTRSVRNYCLAERLPSL
ncbi:MAG TPA: pseudouridine synthase, partial [Permianibacter sp.]|nr:pseudouridine synthase [Permianibacter sp.]